jgi:hypothetical protein
VEDAVSEVLLVEIGMVTRFSTKNLLVLWETVQLGN